MMCTIVRLNLSGQWVLSTDHRVRKILVHPSFVRSVTIDSAVEDYGIPRKDVLKYRFW
jgi:hypothetical protein